MRTALSNKRITALKKQIHGCNVFYIAKERSLKSASDTFKRKLFPGGGREFGKRVNRGSLSDGELEEFIRLCEEVDALRKFVVLNYLAVMKILKKYDR